MSEFLATDAAVLRVRGLVKTFDEGKMKFGDRSFSTSIDKLLEEKCNEKLRALNFPDELIDNESRKKGVEIKF